MRTEYGEHSRPFTGVIVGLVIALAIALLPFYPTTPAYAADSYTFTGGGYGHSVGMSQWGAYGMSRAGFTWQQIMQHYFTDAAPGAVDSSTAAMPLWVNLQVEKSSITLTSRTTGSNPGVPVVVSSSAGTVSIPIGGSFTVSRQADGTCSVASSVGGFTGPCSIDAAWDGQNGDPTTAVILSGCFKMNWNLTTGGQQQACTYSRGLLHFRPDNNTNTVNLSVEMTMEDYVLGISEMPYYWGTTGGQAGLQAQAVAARSYAYNRALQRGNPENRPWCACHLYDTPVDQNYVGWGQGTQAWIDAVRSTENMVMFHPSVTRNGAPSPISTFYSSSTYGFTENSENSFTSVVPYLKSVDDHWSGPPVVSHSRNRWSKTYSPTALAATLPGMNTVTGAAITKCSNSGAALEITFQGSGGPRTFHVRQLRTHFNLLSQQIFEIATPGGTMTCPAPGSGSTTPISSGGSTTTTTAATTTTTAPVTTTTTVPATTTTTVPPSTTSTTVVVTTTTTMPATTTTTVPVTTTTTVPASTTTTTAPQTPSSGSSCDVQAVPVDALLSSSRILRPGTQGADVSDLQSILKALGHYGGRIDGVFGQRTTAAVRSFQDARGLSVDGIVGSRTRGELGALHRAAEHGAVLTSNGVLLKRGVIGERVRALQTLLDELGFSPGPVDGSYGSRTAAAVMAFQNARDLTVDGIVGQQSLSAMLDAIGFGCG